MSKLQKLLDRIRNNPFDVRFEDLDYLLNRHGFKCRQPRSGSSHYTYTRSNCPYILTVPKHRPVNETYVKRALRAMDEFGSLVEED
jgi:hypothetical protein